MLACGLACGLVGPRPFPTIFSCLRRAREEIGAGCLSWMRMGRASHRMRVIVLCNPFLRNLFCVVLCCVVLGWSGPTISPTPGGSHKAIKVQADSMLGLLMKLERRISTAS